MDESFKKQLYNNGLTYKKALDRIVEKYSKLQDQDGAIEVDLENTKTTRLAHYMTLSKKELNKLKSKSAPASREESLGSQDIRDCHLDATCQEGRAHDISTGSSLAGNEGLPTSDTTHITVSSLDENQRNVSVMEVQPEELETSLRSQGSSLFELYPDMISQIERACHRQRVSDTVDTVLKRYRKWRRLPNRSHVSTTFNTTLRQTSSNRKKNGRKLQNQKPITSPLRMHLSGNREAEVVLLSPGQRVTHVKDMQHHHSPGRSLQRREEHPHPTVMDLSYCSSKPGETLLNKTFTVSQLSPQRSQPSIYTVSPSQPCRLTPKASQEVSVRSKLSSPLPNIVHPGGCSKYASESTVSKGRLEIYGSPVRQSPLKARLMSTEGGSSHAFSQSPKSYHRQNYFTELKRPRSVSTSVYSPLQTSTAEDPQKTLYSQDSCHSFQPQLHVPQSATAKGHHRLRRHLSFESSSPPSIRVSYSTKELDNDFARLYHKFVCQSKASSFTGPPCRLCAQSSEGTRGHSSSALAALALSPHRSILRKRHRELGLASNSQSKRSRGGSCTYSPGSKRYLREISHSFSPSKVELTQGDRRAGSWSQNSWQRRLGSLEASRPV